MEEKNMKKNTKINATFDRLNFEVPSFIYGNGKTVFLDGLEAHLLEADYCKKAIKALKAADTAKEAAEAAKEELQIVVEKSELLKTARIKAAKTTETAKTTENEVKRLGGALNQAIKTYDTLKAAADTAKAAAEAAKEAADTAKAAADTAHKKACEEKAYDFLFVGLYSYAYTAITGINETDKKLKYTQLEGIYDLQQALKTYSENWRSDLIPGTPCPEQVKDFKKIRDLLEKIGGKLLNRPARKGYNKAFHFKPSVALTISLINEACDSPRLTKTGKIATSTKKPLSFQKDFCIWILKESKIAKIQIEKTEEK